MIVVEDNRDVYNSEHAKGTVTSDSMSTTPTKLPGASDQMANSKMWDNPYNDRAPTPAQSRYPLPEFVPGRGWPAGVPESRAPDMQPDTVADQVSTSPFFS